MSDNEEGHDGEETEQKRDMLDHKADRIVRQPPQIVIEYRRRRQEETFFRRRLHLGPRCMKKECTKNRRNDPFCLCRVEQLRSEHLDNPRGVPGGLRNLGNTCYMNSYLQTLFHLLPVRRVVLGWRHPPTTFPKAKGKRYDVVLALQKLFARLQMGCERAVDPSELVQAAGVNAAQQQDVHEFSTLFLDWIDQVIADRPNEEKLQSLFTGKMRTTIRCRECRSESTTETDFHDFGLQTQDINDVLKSLTVLFGDDPIDDYNCERCQQNRVADKETRIIALPRYLNVNLLRYVYDKERKVQKKLTHQIGFPQQLDLRRFLTAEQIRTWSDEGCQYELTAVLLHKGSARGGHYRARIRVATHGRWFTFDDVVVTPYSENEHEIDARDAYLLVYEKRRALERDPVPPILPPHLENTRPTVVTPRRMMEVRGLLGDFDTSEFRRFLRVKPSRGVVWLPEDWVGGIVRVITTGVYDHPVRAPDISAHMCPHGRLAEIEGLKAVEQTNAEQLFGLLGFPEPPPVCYASFCPECTEIMDDDEEEESDQENGQENS